MKQLHVKLESILEENKKEIELLSEFHIHLEGCRLTTCHPSHHGAKSKWPDGAGLGPS